MAAPSSKPEAQTPEPHGTADSQDRRPEPEPALAQQLAAKLVVGNYRAMATLISPELAVTPAHVLAQSQILSSDAQGAPIEFLGTYKEPRSATVLAVDESRDFAVLQVEPRVPIDLPASFLRPVDFLEKTKWESYWLTTQGTEMRLEGIVLEELRLNDATYRRLQVSSPITNAEGISGAPVVAGTSLIGIVAGNADNNLGMLWSMIPVTEMINSEETDAVASLLPSDARRARRGRSPWITEKDFQRFSEEGIAVLSDASEISQSLNSTIIHIRDLLLAFLRQPNGQLPELLAEHGANLVEMLGLNPDMISLTRGDFEVLTAVPRISVNVRWALAVAIEKAGRDGPVEDSHLLAAVLSASRNPTVKALNDLGITSAAILVRPASDEREAVLAGYQSDEATGKDLLDIRAEVEALASVLAAKEVDPPLSLGLFGDWGTGKSFFMRKLEAEIKRLGDDAKKAREEGAETAYCSNIVQIPFNAWNYIDSDLWSSLTSEIFENLAAAIVKERGLEGARKPGDAEEIAAQRELALAAASSSEAVLAEAERKKAEAEKELQQTEEKLSALRKSEAEIESALMPSEILRQALGFAMQDPTIQRYVADLTDALGIRESKAAASEVQSEILELKSGWDTILFALKNEKLLFLVWLATLGVAFAAVWAITHYLTDLKAMVGGVVATLAGMSALLRPFVRTVQKAAEVVNRAKESKKELIEKKKKEHTAQLEDTRETVRQNVEATRKNVAEAQAKVKKLNEQLENMRADRRMADYIRERNQSTDYTQHLGIISRVRTDLRHLSTLLRDVNEEEAQDEFERAMKIRQKQTKEEEKKDLFPRIDRIILYIDDLDRCPENNVVKVLQAVHLLLAFPLFVVVVGVDPRWLLYSLQQFSPAFQSKEREKESDLMHDGHWQSTPLNYLEKIFQIPYSLRPISPKGFGQLVEEFAKPKSIWTRHAGTGSPSSRTSSPEAEKTPAASATSGSTAADVTAALPKGTAETASPNQAGAVEASGAAIPQASPSPMAENASHPEQTQTSVPPPPAINRNPAHLQIGDAERAFMKLLHGFIPTPRSGKRFINIYRLLRASVTEGERTAFIGNEQGHQAAMLLLAILTGYPEQATEILRKLIEEEPQGNWWAFVDTVKKDMCPAPPSPSAEGTKKAIHKSGGTTEAVPLEEVAGAGKTSWVELMERLERFKVGFSDRRVDQFRLWAPRVARYSFQSGRVLYYERESARASDS